MVGISLTNHYIYIYVSWPSAGWCFFSTLACFGGLFLPSSHGARNTFYIKVSSSMFSEELGDGWGYICDPWDGDSPRWSPSNVLSTRKAGFSRKCMKPQHVGAESVKTLQLLFLPKKLSSLEVRFWWFWNHSDRYTGRAFLRRADTWFHIYHLESRWFFIARLLSHLLGLASHLF